MSAPAALVAEPTLDDGGDAHADDSYCALCRRCQMRKKLERRLAARRDAAPHAAAAARPGAARIEAGGGSGVGVDAVSVDELLVYIGGGVSLSGTRPRRKRRAKGRAAAAAAVGSSGGDGREVDGDGDCEGEGDCGGGRREAQYDDVFEEECTEDGESDGSSDAARSKEEDLLRPRGGGGCCGVDGGIARGYAAAELDALFDDELMSKEEQAAIDREVEAFRLSLESVGDSGSPGAGHAAAQNGIA